MGCFRTPWRPQMPRTARLERTPRTSRIGHRSRKSRRSAPVRTLRTARTSRTQRHRRIRPRHERSSVVRAHRQRFVDHFLPQLRGLELGRHGAPAQDPGGPSGGEGSSRNSHHRRGGPARDTLPASARASSRASSMLPATTAGQLSRRGPRAGVRDELGMKERASGDEASTPKRPTARPREISSVRQLSRHAAAWLLR